MLRTVTLVTNATKSKFTYHGSRIAIDGEGSWSIDNDFAWNVIIFGLDNSWLSHADNQNINFLVLCEGPTYGINDSTCTAENHT